MPKRFACLALMLISSLALTGGAISAGLPQISVPEEVSIIGERVYLGALLTSAELGPTLEEQLDRSLFALAPGLGKTKILSGAEIRSRLQALGLTSEKYLIQIPEQIKVTRKFQTVTPSEITAKVTQDFLPTLPWEDVHLERIEIAEAVLLPVGKLGLSAYCTPRTDLARPFYLNLDFRVDGELVRRAFYRTTLAIHHTVAISATAISSSQRINSSDLRWEKRRLPSTVRTPVEDLQFFEGKRTRTDIAADRILTKDLFLSVPIIRRGDTLLLVFQDGTMRLTTRGKSLGSGFRGDRIPVMNLDSGKTLLAEVVDEKTARLVF